MRIASCIALVLISAWPLAASSQETVVVRPDVIDDVLVNPGIGFMTFQRFNGDTLNEGKKWTEGPHVQFGITNVLCEGCRRLDVQSRLPGSRSLYRCKASPSTTGARNSHCRSVLATCPDAATRSPVTFRGVRHLVRVRSG